MPYIDFTAEQLGTKRCVAETHESLVGDGLGRWYEKKAKPGVAFGNVCQACYTAKVKTARHAKLAPKNNPFPTDVADLVTRIKKDEANAKRREAKAAQKRAANEAKSALELSTALVAVTAAA